MPSEATLFTGIGPKLTLWRVNLERHALDELASLTLPANVQYAWPHPTQRCLHVVSSDGGTRHGPRGDRHHLTACTVARRSGGMAVNGEAMPLPSRPIHVTIDPSGTHTLVAFNQPSAIRVYSIKADASPGAEVAQPEAFDFGNYAHQVRVTADESFVLSTALGGNPWQGRAEEPGAINVFRYAKGQLSRQQVVAPNDGFGFGPRHIDIHPNGRWVYVSLERQNRLEMFELDANALSDEPKFSQPLLSRPMTPGITQSGGTVHVHPNGRFVYGVNRASDSADLNGTKVFAGGENTLAVFEIEGSTGRPVLIQHVKTMRLHCRTFHIDPTGRHLVAAHILGMNVKDGDRLQFVPARLSVFRIADDGRLHFHHVHDMATHGAMMFWMGMPDG